MIAELGMVRVEGQPHLGGEVEVEHGELGDQAVRALLAVACSVDCEFLNY